MADDRKLQDLARNDPNKFEEYYRKNIDKNAKPEIIAAKQKYYKEIDLSKVNSSSSSSSGGGGYVDAGKKSGGFGLVENILGHVDEALGKMAGAGQKLFATQIGKGDASDTSTSQILDIVKQKGLTAAPLELISKMYDTVLEQLGKESKLLSDVNSKTGISGELSQSLRYDMVAAQGEAKKYGFELEDIGKFYTDLSEQSGKFSLINKTTIVEASKTAAALNMSLSDLAGSISDYERVGIGAKETTKAIGDAAVRSISLGLNARKVADGMKESIGKLNEYGFKNGVEGLERMVQKSIEFRMSMENVTTIAEKVLNPEGAIDLAANLQVLGGAMGDFGDPIKLMYDATNNVEGLQDSLIGAAKGLATYNSEQGRFEITGINLRRAREMANSLGISMSDLTKTAVAAQERMSASTALMSTGLQMDDKDKDFLTNLSRMQGGEMKIVVPESLQDKLGKQSEITLSKLTEDQKKVLLANKEAFEKMNPEKIAMSQLTETEKISRNMDVVAAYAKIRAASYLRGAAGEALGKQMQGLYDTVSGLAKKGVNPKESEEAGKNLVKTFTKEGFIEGTKTLVTDLVNGVKTTLTKQTPQEIAQQQVVQKVEHNVNITASPLADWAKEAAKKDAAFNFEFTNSKGYDILSVAKKKGK
jgi:hypothetical protein